MCTTANIAGNRELAILGRYLRPLLSEVGSALGMPEAGIMGINFPNPNDESSRVLFAEYLNPANRADCFDDDYILPSLCKFISAIDIAADSNTHISPYTVTSDEPDAVKVPLKKEFPNETEPLIIYAVHMDHPSVKSVIIYCIGPATQSFDSMHKNLHVTQSFLITILRDALFLAAAAESGRGDWSDKLASLLPEVFPLYTNAQKVALTRIRHPYLQILNQQSAISPPNVVVESGYAVDDKQILSAVTGVEEIRVTGLLSDSFQDHQVYSATIKPRAGAAPFEAVIKPALKQQADREWIGYFTLLPYFRDIRDVMPSPPLVFPTELKGVDTTEDMYSVVTPHFGGRSLATFIRGNWTDNVIRVPTLIDVFKQLREFIEKIRPPKGPTVTSEPFLSLYESHLGDTEGQRGRRFEKTLEELTRRLPEKYKLSPIIEFLGETLYNPLWVMSEAPRESDGREMEEFWRSSPHALRMVRYGHGDLHVGNVLFAPDDGRVTILDFDYVGEHREHEDAATLEVSFVLSAAASPLFQLQDKWKASWPEAVLFLAGKRSLDAVENNRLAHDLAQLVAVIRGKPISDTGNTYMVDDYHYHACVATALLRLFTSHSRKMPGEDFRPVGATALFWLGLLLRGFVRSHYNERPLSINLFEDLQIS